MNRTRPVDPAQAWTALALGLPPSPPSAELRERVLAAAGRAAPFRPHLTGLARCFDLTEAAVHRLLARMDDPAEWTPGLGATLAFLHFDAGPGCAVGPAHCGIARMRGGARIPVHVHRSRELNFVLRGALVDDAGRRVEAGGILESAAGSSHALTIHGDPEAILAVLLPEIEIVPPR